MDLALARELRVGDVVLYREARHTVVDIALHPWPSMVFKLQGPYATETYVSYALLDFPVLLNPPEKES